MNKQVTLDQNITKLQNSLNAVKTLSEILEKCDINSANLTVRKNKKYLRKTLKNVSRLNVVIQKQISEKFPTTALVNKNTNTNTIVNGMFNLLKNSEIDQFKVKRDESTENKYEIWEGNIYCGRFSF